MTESSTGPASDLAGPDDFPEALSRQRLRAIVTELAADRYTGRRIGTPGGRAAATWLAGQLRDLGAAVTIDPVPTAPVKEMSAMPAFTWTADGRTYVGVHRRDFAQHLASAHLPKPLAAPVTTGTAASGRWLLAPAYRPDVAAAAHAVGAVGLLVPRGTDDAGWMPKMIAGPAAGPLPVLSLRTDIHRQLTDDADGDMQVTASLPLRTAAAAGVNVYAVFREPNGEDAASVLLTAHFDGVGDDPVVRLPAACDNASGVAVAIEAARLLRTLLPDGVGLAVALLDGEEIGAVGSAHHAPQVRPGTFVLNIDGAAQLSGAAAIEAGGPAHRLLAALDQAGAATGIPLVAAAMPSDNRRYAAAGLPAIGIGMGMPGYQTPAETPDRVETSTLVEATWLTVATVRILIHNSTRR